MIMIDIKRARLLRLLNYININKYIDIKLIYINIRSNLYM